MCVGGDLSVLSHWLYGEGGLGAVGCKWERKCRPPRVPWGNNVSEDYRIYQTCLRRNGNDEANVSKRAADYGRRPYERNNNTRSTGVKAQGCNVRYFYGKV